MENQLKMKGKGKRKKENCSSTKIQSAAHKRRKSLNFPRKNLARRLLPVGSFINRSLQL